MKHGPKSILKKPNSDKAEHQKEVSFSILDDVFIFDLNKPELISFETKRHPNRAVPITPRFRKEKGIVEEFKSDMTFYGQTLLYVLSPAARLVGNAFSAYFEPLPGENIEDQEYKEKYKLLL